MQPSQRQTCGEPSGESPVPRGHAGRDGHGTRAGALTLSYRSILRAVAPETATERVPAHAGRTVRPSQRQGRRATPEADKRYTGFGVEGGYDGRHTARYGVWGEQGDSHAQGPAGRLGGVT